MNPRSEAPGDPTEICKLLGVDSLFASRAASPKIDSLRTLRLSVRLSVRFGPSLPRTLPPSDPASLGPCDLGSLRAEFFVVSSTHVDLFSAFFAMGLPAPV